jgi:predicted flap endonuclease-1-like 5' DNA nuclease
LEEAYQAYKVSAKEEYKKLEADAKEWLEKLESYSVELSQHKEMAEELEANKKQLVLELEKTKKRYKKELTLSGGELEALNETFEGLKDKYFQVNKELSSTQLEKERISHQHEHFQEQVRGELQLIRNENKSLAMALNNAKAERRVAEQEKQALLERIEQLENFEGGSTPDQAKLIKIITRLRKNVAAQQEQLQQVQHRAASYQERIAQLEQKLGEQGEHVSKDDLQTIAGIDKSTVQTLEDFGVHTFAALASLSQENQELLSQVLEVPIDQIKGWMTAASSYLEQV